jgi:dienelactone hydrolase
MSRQPWKVILFISLCLTLFLTLSLYSQLELPATGGTFAVGQTVLNWVDTSRAEDLTEAPNDFREVVALVWYPAEAKSGVQADYFSNLSTVSDALVQSGEVKTWQVLGLRFVRSESRWNANPIKSEEQFPVMVLSPGNGTNIEFYSSLASEIASHGYVVVGLNHPYDVPAVQLASGDIAPYDKDQWLLDPEAHQAYIAERIKVRTADIRFALEQLDDFSTNRRFAGIMNLDAVAVAGHSLGGITAAEACKADPRFKACLNFDGLQRGGPFSMDENAIPPEQPFLFLTKEAQLHPTLLERFESMPESYWVIVHGTSHQSFTDGPLLQPSLLPGSNQADRFMEWIGEYTVAFLDSTLKGQPNDMLSGAVERQDISVKVFPSNN